MHIDRVFDLEWRIRKLFAAYLEIHIYYFGTASRHHGSPYPGLHPASPVSRVMVGTRLITNFGDPQLSTLSDDYGPRSKSAKLIVTLAEG